MAKASGKVFETDCDKDSMRNFMDTIKTTVKAISIFNNEFTDFLDESKKLAKDLFNWVTRYNILNAWVSIQSTIISIKQKLAILAVRLVFILKSKKKNCFKKCSSRSRIRAESCSILCKPSFINFCCSLQIILSYRQQIKLIYEKLPQLHRVLEKESQIVDWDPSKNILIKGSVKHLPPSQYLEEIADILYQYDVSITSIFQYFDALELHDAKSYENLTNSYALSTEVTEFVKEFLIKTITLLIWSGKRKFNFNSQPPLHASCKSPRS